MRLIVITIFFIITHLYSSPVIAESTLPSIAHVQQKLKLTGYDVTVVDGVFGPQTSAAIREFQKKSGLKITGTLNEDVAAALNLSENQTVLTVKQLQQMLLSEGFDIKVADGIFGPNTSIALKEYQKKHSLEATGFISLSLSHKPKKTAHARPQQTSINPIKERKKAEFPQLLPKKEPLVSPVLPLQGKQRRPAKRNETIIIQNKTPKHNSKQEIVGTQKLTPQLRKKIEPDTWIILTIIGIILVFAVVAFWLVFKISRWLLQKIFYGRHGGPIVMDTKRININAKNSAPQHSLSKIPAASNQRQSNPAYSTENRTGAIRDDNSSLNNQEIYEDQKSTSDDLTTVHVNLSPRRAHEDFVPISDKEIIDHVPEFSGNLFHKSKRQTPKCWVPKGVATTIAGITISNGMLYVGTKLPTQQRYGGQDNCLINPKLKVARSGEWGDDDYMPYWPSYSDISPKRRRQYLEWLATDANDPDAYAGYVFLYFYGLERRLFLDQSIEDRADIIDEIKRLLFIYGENRSVSRYLNEALSYSDIILGKSYTPRPIAVIGEHHWELPMVIKIYLGSKLKHNPVLDIDDLILWFLSHPERRLRTPASRLEKEFLALLRIKLSKLFPDGLRLKIPKKIVSATYSASSNTFTAELSKQIGDIPDISGFRAPIEKVQKIADQVMDKLDKLSRFLGRNPGEKGSIKAAGLLPAELVKEFGGENINALQDWVQAQVQINSGIITISDIASRTSGQNPGKVTKTVYKELFQLMTSLGWNVAPAANELIGTPKPEMKILLQPFENGGLAIEKPSNGFLLAVLELALGAYIAHADSHVLEEEIAHLSLRAQNMHYLGRAERNRLDYYIQWLSHQDIDTAALKRKLKSLDQASRNVFANLAVAIAAADGVIAPQEVRALETIYKVMDFDKKELFSSLHALAGDAGKTKKAHSVSQFATSNGKSSPEIPVALNAERITQTLHDTAKASNLLAAIFDDEEKQQIEEPEIVVEQNEEENLFGGLDGVHSQLLQELLCKKQWQRDEFERLAASLKLLPDGAMETINEWAFGSFDDAIIEDDDPLIINSEILLEGN